MVGGQAGEFVSAVREAKLPFNNAVLSWNADAPEGTTVRFELRVLGDGGWSGWYAMGEWTHEGGRSIGGQVDDRGRVDIDTLKLSQLATALQYRVRLESASSTASPMVRQISVTIRGPPRWPQGAGASPDFRGPFAISMSRGTRSCRKTGGGQRDMQRDLPGNGYAILGVRSSRCPM